MSDFLDALKLLTKGDKQFQADKVAEGPLTPYARARVFGAYANQPGNEGDTRPPSTFEEALKSGKLNPNAMASLMGAKSGSA